jgi:ankyrin repeat protein
MASDEAAPPPPAKEARMPVSGPDADLLFDAARLVALNGYAHECRLLPFLSPDYHREEDFLVATRHLRYGPKQRARLMSLARGGDARRVSLLLSLLLKVRADVIAASIAANLDVVHNLSDEEQGRVLFDEEQDRVLFDEEQGRVLFDEKQGRVLFDEEQGRVLFDEEQGRVLFDEEQGRVLFDEEQGRVLFDEEQGRVLFDEEQDRVLFDEEQGRVLSDEEQDRVLSDEEVNIDAADTNGWTPLPHATAGQHLDVVRRLIDESTVVTAKDADGRTALHHASIAGHIEVVRLLLEREKDDEKRDLDHKDEDGRTALFHAELNDHLDIVELLAKEGASLDCTDENRENVLSRAIARGDMESVRRLVALGAAVSGEHIFHLHQACAAGNVELVRLLLEREKDDEKRVLSQVDLSGLTPLHHAEHNGHRAVTELLAEAHANMNMTNGSDETVLDRAIDEGDEASVRRLVALGATVSGEYLTYLHKASAAGSVAMVELLLELGADVDATDDSGGSAMFYAECNGHDAVTAVLAKAHADMDRSAENGTVLDWAIERDDVASIRRLVGLGAKLQKDGRWTAPLHVASRAGREKAVRALLELGADVDAREGDVVSGSTALHMACEMGFAETARALVEGGADWTARDEEGHTPLELAVLHGKARTARIVEEAVAVAVAAAAAAGEEAVMAQGEGVEG